MAIPDLLIVFAVIGLLELSDRTNFALIGLASRRSGFLTWAGAATAFLVTSAIAVAIGTVVLAFLRPEIRLVQLAGGVLILVYAAHLARRTDPAEEPPARRSAFMTAFLLILLLEMGDSTMILLVLFTGGLGDPIGVFLVGSAALLGVAAFACTLGGQLGARVEPKTLDRIVIGILVFVGGATILFALFPSLLPSVLS
ncbi:MAG: TMEM165/GDT1 family protein [Thermoplasmata archaeon]|nr:TMEM165/GDT1 family protein [Thermoplasmata archaeon]MCI4358848.1 TMEM165/GDT1 family protein [Thermoplasmata archaeon]